METKNRFTYTGTLHEIGKVKTFSSGLRKCEIVCKTTNGEYTDYAVFVAKKELADKTLLLKVGETVSVDFVLDAREWDGPKGKRWFSDALAIRIETVSGVNAGSVNAPTQSENEPEIFADDLPF